VLKVQRGAYKLVKQCRTYRSPTFSYVRGFPFYSPRWGPHLHISSAESWHHRGALRSCHSSGPTRSVGSGQARSWRFSWATGDLGNLFGQRVVPVLSHPDSVGAARSLGWLFGGHLRSCPSWPTFLISMAILRFPCVAPASRTAHPVRGALPRSDRGCPVTLAGVMGWCAGATIITAREGTSVDAPLL